MTRIIAISGRAQAGKTTIANNLKDYVDSPNDLNELKSCKIYSFAQPLKDICRDILGLTEEQLKNKDSITHLKWENMPGISQIQFLANETGGPCRAGNMTSREVLQFVGTNIFRRMHNNCWIDATMNKIRQDNLDLALIDDARFPSEIKAIHREGGVVVRLTRNPLNMDHESETELDQDMFDWANFDVVLDNKNMSLEEQENLIIEYLLLPI